MGGLINAIDISAQGLSAQRAKMNVVAQNMANAETVETPEGGPYKRQRVIISSDKASSPFSRDFRGGHAAPGKPGTPTNKVRLTVGSVDVLRWSTRVVDRESNFRDLRSDSPRRDGGIVNTRRGHRSRNSE
jgi:flagellar basal body rod protein FlgC